MNINNHKFTTKGNGKHKESFEGSSREVKEVHVHGST
jgi:hypothetical protein